MEISLTTLLIFAVGFALIKWGSKLLTKLLGLVLMALVVLFFMFYFEIGSFKSNPLSLQELEVKYCDSSESKVKCSCIVKLLKADMNRRWTEDELADLEHDHVDMAYAMNKSLQIQKTAIKACLADEGAEQEWDEFTNDLIPVNNDWIERIKLEIKKLKTKTETSVQKVVDRKKDIDDRYED
ncbi:MAG: hypothetical protein ACI8ZN_001978 [Bacteroidia bacterium]